MLRFYSNCDLSIKLSGGENMDRIALEKLLPSFCTLRTAAAWPKGALMIHMNEALIVEGRYDSKLSALTDELSSSQRTALHLQVMLKSAISSASFC